jgi:hypothetical protein
VRRGLQIASFGHRFVDGLRVWGPTQLGLTGAHHPVSVSKTIAPHPPSEVLNPIRHRAVIIHDEPWLSAVSLYPKDPDRHHTTSSRIQAAHRPYGNRGTHVRPLVSAAIGASGSWPQESSFPVNLRHTAGHKRPGCSCKPRKATMLYFNEELLRIIECADKAQSPENLASLGIHYRYR